MKIGKILERSFKRSIYAPLVLLRYGSLRPAKVRITGCDHFVFIDPEDRRAVKKFIYDPVRKRVSPPLRFWRDFNQHISPAIALDIGVNYGECLFGSRYAEKTEVYGFEANPTLLPYLEKSRQSHPEREQIKLVSGLVSNRVADDIDFFVDPTWSGTASAIPQLNGDQKTVKLKVSSHRLDDIIPTDTVAGHSILFKMDIKGYESFAFKGFTQTINAAALTVGLIEFDTTYITKAGASPTAYFNRLKDLFEIYRIASIKRQSLQQIDNFDQLPRSRAEDERTHTDLILVSKDRKSEDWMPQGWKLQHST